jgi:hypothetical protein
MRAGSDRDGGIAVAGLLRRQDRHEQVVVVERLQRGDEIALRPALVRLDLSVEYRVIQVRQLLQLHVCDAHE